VLEQARVFESLESAVAGAGFVAAFTGKKDREAPLEDVRETAATIAGLDADLSAALVFGPEDAGLTRAELALCGRRVAIPAHSQQPSLNLSHAVMVAAYEVFRARASGRAAPRRASHAEKQAMLLLLRDGLARVGALPAANSEGYFLDWQNLFQRADLTPKEVRLLEHLARKLKGRE
jgi:tRNA/rRNA methyltransferase